MSMIWRRMKLKVKVIVRITIFNDDIKDDIEDAANIRKGEIASQESGTFQFQHTI